LITKSFLAAFIWQSNAGNRLTRHSNLPGFAAILANSDFFCLGLDFYIYAVLKSSQISFGQGEENPQKAAPQTTLLKSNTRCFSS